MINAFLITVIMGAWALFALSRVQRYRAETVKTFGRALNECANVAIWAALAARIVASFLLSSPQGVNALAGALTAAIVALWAAGWLGVGISRLVLRRPQEQPR